MPFIDGIPDDQTEPSGLPPQGDYKLDITTPTPSFGRLLDAAFAESNIAGSVQESRQYRLGSTFDPSFDPFQNIEGYEDYATSFVDANNDEDVFRVKSKIDAERRRDDLLSAGGAYGVAAEIIAGMADPINLIPVGGEAVAVGRLGYRLTQGALRVGRAGLVSTAAQEALLNQMQETRTFAESAANVAAGTFLSGILGGAISGVAGRNLDTLAKTAFAEADGIANEFAANIDGGSVGAAARRDTTMDQETLKSALGVEKAISQTSPTLRLAQSPSLETRRLAQELADQPLEFKKNMEGLETPVSVESRMRLWQGPLAESMTEMDDLFVRYRTGKDRSFGDLLKLGARDMVSPDPQTLTRDQFMEEVGRAMRRGDASDIPEVAQAAKVLRDKIFDPLKERAIKAELLPEDVSVETADSYLTRVYNLPKIVARRPEFEDRITTWLNGQQGEVAERVDLWRESLSKAEAEVKKLEPLNEAITKFKDVDERLKQADRKLRKANKVNRESAESMRLTEKVKTLQKEWDALKPDYDKASRYGMKAKEIGKKLEKAKADVKRLTPKIDQEFAFARADKLELQDIARQITDQLLGSSPARALYTPVPLVRGPLKERTLNIPDKDIEDFLESDVSRIARIYTRTMSADVELATQFGRADMADQMEAIRSQYATLRNGVTDEGKLKKLDDRMNADMRDLQAIRDRLRGTYDMPTNPGGLAARAQRVVLDLNYLRLLGGMTISALPDLGRSVMVHGISRVFNNGIVPLVKNLKEVKLSAKEVKLAGTALDMVLDTRAMSLADVMDDYGRWSKLERGMTALTNKFGLVSLMAPWNAAIKQFVGIVSQTRTLEAIENFARASQKEKTRLASLGLSPEMVERIGRMYAKHGEDTGNLKWANTIAWEDKEAADVFRAHLAKEVDTAIVTPGQEKPLWMSKGIGRMVGQFRSFNLSSAQRVTLAGLQRRDMATLNGAALMTGLGMLAYFLKTDHDRVSDDPKVWIKEGIDRAGLTGWMFDVNGIIEKSTRGAVGVSKLTGGPQMSRYASRGVLESLLGPTAGLITQSAQIVGSGATGEWTEADTRAVRRMLPFQNLIGWKHVFDQAEEGINQTLGVPKS